MKATAAGAVPSTGCPGGGTGLSPGHVASGRPGLPFDELHGTVGCRSTAPAQGKASITHVSVCAPEILFFQVT